MFENILIALAIAGAIIGIPLLIYYAIRKAQGWEVVFDV